MSLLVIALLGQSLAAAPDRRVWNAARTEFRSVGTGWFVLTDSDD